MSIKLVGFQLWYFAHRMRAGLPTFPAGEFHLIESKSNCKSNFKLARMYLNFFKRASTSSDTVTERPATKVEEDKEAAAAAAEDLRGTIYDIIRTIKDPEKAATLEDLNVVYEDGVRVLPPFSVSNTPHVKIEFNPTVPHCSLATMIGLCIRVKIQRCLPKYVKLEIYIKKGSHDIEDEVNKQINDKERIAAAMENPSLKELVEGCIKEEE